MDTYKKGEYIAVMTNQPSIHFLEMFGHGLSTDNVKPSKYVGKIMNVIDDENYQILIVHPIPVYRCVIHVSEILRKVSETELDEDSKGVEENIEFLAPNVYVNNAELNGDSADDKCTALAELAMKSMFPMYQITSFEMASSELLKTDLIDCIDWLIKANMNHDERFVRNLKKKGQYFSKMLQNLRFKEYYTIRVGVKTKMNPHLLIISIYSLIPDSKKSSLHVIFRSVVGSSEVWGQNMLRLVNICLIFAVKC